MALDATLPVTQSTFLSPSETALHALPSALRQWFLQRYECPTTAQCRAWPAIAAGNHVLLAAPTGSGKTLGAFLPILGELLAQPQQGLRCIYLAPLKALGTDVRRTLRRCCREISANNPALICPRIAIRTGDTSNRLRRRDARASRPTSS